MTSVSAQLNDGVLDFIDPGFIGVSTVTTRATDRFSWNSAGGSEIYLYGEGFVYDADGNPVSGTVSRIEILVPGNMMLPDIIVTLDVSITDLFDPDAPNQSVRFWDAVFDGETSFRLMHWADYFNGYGDRAYIGAGETVTCADDVASAQSQEGSFYGDFIEASGAVVYGGADIITSKGSVVWGDGGTVANGSQAYGGADTFTAYTFYTYADHVDWTGDFGTVSDSDATGGDDILHGATEETAVTCEMVGDFGTVEGTGTARGGDDEITGSGGNDDLVGDAGSNSATLIGGNDTIRGHGGDDVIYGDARSSSGSGSSVDCGNDILYGGDGNDTIYGDVGISGGMVSGGNDVIQGGAGADALFGGDGYDLLSYVDSTAGVQVSLATNTAAGGDAAGDTFSGFENLVGSGHADFLVGSGGANHINGRAGDDTVAGGAGNDTLIGDAGDDLLLGNNGNDTLIGGQGRDVLHGGNHADTFVYRALSDSGVLYAGRDRIQDFLSGTDVIDLSALDADTGTAGDQAFTLVGGAFTGAAGQLRIWEAAGLTFIEGDVDGNGHADFRIELLGTGLGIDAGDFVL
ncbi:calcium-binding protein [Zhengella sp. ZM62]|uniref:calcium-binding protein n=1 Tax=Zhengella sedimenti TaxID=3390035 RepID=UPI0039765634